MAHTLFWQNTKYWYFFQERMSGKGLSQTQLQDLWNRVLFYIDDNKLHDSNEELIKEVIKLFCGSKEWCWIDVWRAKYEEYVKNLLKLRGFFGAEAADLAGQTWLKIYEDGEKYNWETLPVGGSEAKGYVWIRARDKCVDLIKKKSRERKGLEKLFRRIESITRRSTDPLRDLINKEWLEGIMKFLEKYFDEEEQAILYLKFAGYSAKEIDDFLGCGEDKVKNTVKKLRRLIRKRALGLKEYVF